jgi:diamine N-acetyltransferase
MEYSIKDIKKDKINIIQPLWEQLNQIHLADSIHFKEHYKTFTFERRIESITKKDESDIKISLVVIDNQNRGYCFSTVDGLNGEIDSLYLDAEIRGSGIGKILVEEHIKWLREKGCLKIRLGVSFGHDSVLEFYHKLGLYERMIYLEYKP